MRVGKPRMDKYPKIKLVCIMRWNRPEYRINRIRTKIFNRFHMDMDLVNIIEYRLIVKNLFKYNLFIFSYLRILLI